MQLEKEVRYLVDDAVWKNALDKSAEYKEKVKMLDITMGAFGRESVAKTGKVFRVRQKPDKITLEIKNRIDGGWQEESIVLDSVERGVSFLTLAGLKPYLFISRMREVRKYKNLKIFFDDIELLGKYIEIEYQDSLDSENELREFCSLCGISGIDQPLYGDIINKRYEEDIKFKQSFDEYLKTITNN
ncbi:MAG: CYTH domain-containing protein [Christensenellales bacterium]